MTKRFLALLGAFLLMPTALAEPPAVGDLAPDFNLPGSDGRDYRLGDLRGDYVVLAFFPKAFTGG